MAMYDCEVLNELGERKRLVKEAGDLTSLKARLKGERYYLVKARLIADKKPNTFFAVSSKVKMKEVVMFLRQFAVMIAASISIADALDALSRQHVSKAFKKVLMDVHQDVLSGMLLSEAFAKHPKVFPSFFVDMVAIGEVSGSLDTVLASMADYYEKEQKMKRKARSAMVYPTILLVMIVVVLFFMSLVILPEFEGMITELGGEVPLITQIILSISRFIQANILYIVLGIAGVVLLLFLYGKTKAGRYQYDYLKLHLPFIGRINVNLITARFARAFIILLDSGMNITDCMENLLRMLGNQVFYLKFRYAIDEVKRGKRLAKAVEVTGLFPMMMVEMLDVGEKSGNLEEVLNSTIEYFDNSVETSITRATSALEPTMIIFLGLVVAVVILAVYLPIISMMQNIA